MTNKCEISTLSVFVAAVFESPTGHSANGSAARVGKAVLEGTFHLVHACIIRTHTGTMPKVVGVLLVGLWLFVCACHAWDCTPAGFLGTCMCGVTAANATAITSCIPSSTSPLTFVLGGMLCVYGLGLA